MAKSISCKDAGKDCAWSATAETEEGLLAKVKDHVLEHHKEITLDAESVAAIKGIIKDC